MLSVSFLPFEFPPNQYKGIDDTIVQWLCRGALRTSCKCREAGEN